MDFRHCPEQVRKEATPLLMSFLSIVGFFFQYSYSCPYQVSAASLLSLMASQLSESAIFCTRHPHHIYGHLHWLRGSMIYPGHVHCHCILFSDVCKRHRSCCKRYKDTPSKHGWSPRTHHCLSQTSGDHCPDSRVRKWILANCQAWFRNGVIIVINPF